MPWMEHFDPFVSLTLDGNDLDRLCLLANHQTSWRELDIDAKIDFTMDLIVKLAEENHITISNCICTLHTQEPISIKITLTEAHANFIRSQFESQGVQVRRVVPVNYHSGCGG